MKSIFLVCDKDGNPFTDTRNKESFVRAWAFKHEDEANDAKGKSQIVIEYRPVKGK